MDRSGGIFERIALAMTGKGNPWGRPPGGGDGGNDGGGSDGDAPSGSDEGSSDGPRNPWLPGGGSDEGRRSASIEDIFKNKKGSGRSGGGGGGGSFRMPQRPGGKSWMPVILLAVVSVWLVISSFHLIQPGERAVVTWMGGKYDRNLNPGTNFTFPWPISQVDVENVERIRLERIPEGDSEEKLILTSDQNLVDLSYLIRWNISNLALYRFQLEDPDDTLREVAESAMRAAIAEQDLDTVLTGAGRAEIEARVQTNMQGILDAFRSGISVQGVEINRTDAPQQVIAAFNDVLAARQDRERQLNDARRFEQQVLAQAQGGAAAFNNIYDEYRLAPEVTRRRLYYETMELVLSQTDKTIVEADNVTPYLALPELRRRAQENAEAAATTTGGQ